MLTSAKEKLGHMKRITQGFAGLGAMFVERTANKERLLRNSDFLLIHVPEDEGGWRPPPKIVIPAVDRPTRHKVREQGYFTVSHLWGPPEEWKPWTSHGIIGIDGKIVQVKVRPEKQNTLLHLLQSTPEYWWIDIFCAQSKTPTSIMGHVYRFCHRCYALVDYPSAGFYQIEVIAAYLRSLRSEDDLVEIYTERIKGKLGSAEQTWFESLEDLLGGWYDGDPADIKALADFFSCQWFTRVWTLQEYILPFALTFISEADPVHCQLDRVVLTVINQKLYGIAEKFLEQNLASAPEGDYQGLYFTMSNDQYNHVLSTPGLSRSHFDLTRFDTFCLCELNTLRGAVKGFNILTLRYGSSNMDGLIIVLKMIARLPRTCMYTRDYIYGVAGLLDMNIPAGGNDEEVWGSFRNIVQKRAPYVKFPETVSVGEKKKLKRTINDLFLGFRSLEDWKL